jgi:WD40 repeat protein
MLSSTHLVLFANPLCTGGEDGTVRVWDLRSPGCQREYGSRAAVNTVVLHPNQGELISGEGGADLLLCFVICLGQQQQQQRRRRQQAR